MTITSLPPYQSSDAEVEFWSSADEREAVRARSRRRWRDRRHRLRTLAGEGGSIALLVGVIYFIVALLLAYKYHVFEGDAVSRMANGWYVLFSRDPHLAAIGFVWNPLPSIIDLMFLLFKDLWPGLSNHDMAGALMSVTSMVGAVHQLRAALKEWGVAPLPRLILTLLFALNPMIVYYAANGMSEALYLFTLIATTRYFARWIRRNDLRSLVYAGIFMGLCYLAREEAVLPAVALGASVFLFACHRDSGQIRQKLMAGLTDTLIFVFPFAASLVSWATVSYVITGEPFQQYTSQYGNSSQLLAQSIKAPPLAAALHHELVAITYLSPLLSLIAVVALVRAVSQRDPLVVAIIGGVGGGLAFDMLAYAKGAIFDWYRFYIATIPLGVLLLGTVVMARSPEQRAQRAGLLGQTDDDGVFPMPPRSVRPWPRRAAVQVGCAAVAVLAIGPSLPSSAIGMFNPKVGVEETEFLGFVFHRHLTEEDLETKQTYSAVLAIDGYIERLHLPNGDIVVDNFSPCIPNVIVTMADPRVFVIPNDRDFQRVLADPLTFHTHYILEADPTALGSLTAVNKLYPTLYDSGGGFAKLFHQLPARGNCPQFRLFRVTGHPPTA